MFTEFWKPIGLKTTVFHEPRNYSRYRHQPIESIHLAEEGQVASSDVFLEVIDDGHAFSFAFANNAELAFIQLRETCSFANIVLQDGAMRPRIFSDKDWQSGSGRHHFQLSFRSSRTLLCSADTWTMTRQVGQAFASFLYENVLILCMLQVVFGICVQLFCKPWVRAFFGTRYQDGIQVRS